jgi:hypothetical protein
MPFSHQFLTHHVLLCALSFLHQPNAKLRSLLESPSTRSAVIISQILSQSKFSLKFSSSIDLFFAQTVYNMNNIQVSHSFDRYISVA